VSVTTQTQVIFIRDNKDTTKHRLFVLNGNDLQQQSNHKSFKMSNRVCPLCKSALVQWDMDTVRLTIEHRQEKMFQNDTTSGLTGR